MSFDAEIARINTQITNLREQAEPAVQKFLDAATTFLCDWSREKVEREVTSNPELTKQLGKEGLGRLKSELGQLIGEMPEHVQSHLNQDQLWLHRGEIPQGQRYSLSPYDFHGYRPPDKLNDQVRILLGYAGALLVKFGFAKYDDNSDWKLIAGAVPKYRFGVDWSADLKSTAVAYSDIYKRLLQLAEKLETTKREKAESEAKHLWDEA
jgi:hypothetical protein